MKDLTTTILDSIKTWVAERRNRCAPASPCMASG